MSRQHTHAFRILDVGCGANPTGEVNCDLFIGDTPHSHVVINPKLLENFIRCDAEFLPLRDSSFDIVYSKGLLEHLRNPFQAMKEFKRVSSNLVYLTVPNIRNMEFQHPKHIFSWDKTTFRNFLENFFEDVDVYCSYGKLFKGRLTNRITILRIILHAFLRAFPIQLIAICRK